MPVLKNPKHELFAQELAKGKNQTEAYKAAGYQVEGNVAETSASRLFRNAQVVARVTELQERGAQRAEITVQSLIEEAEEARQLALKLGQSSAAVAATREKGVLSGRRIERAEVGRPGDFEAMSDDDLDRAIGSLIASRQNPVGAGSSRAGSTNGQAGVRGKSSRVH